MTIAPPHCTCWMVGPFPCDIHGIEPREYHTCQKGEYRGGARSNCHICIVAGIETSRNNRRLLAQRKLSAARGGYD